MSERKPTGQRSGRSKKSGWEAIGAIAGVVAVVVAIFAWQLPKASPMGSSLYQVGLVIN